MERVLVVDDGDLDRKIVRDLLESAGYEVEEAADGETALRLLYQQQPDLVLLDVVLPRMDGWTICRRIRELCDTPVIMLTSLNSEDEIARGLDLGADDFISKPIGATSLLARVRAVLRRAGAPQHEPASVYDDGSLRIEPALRRVTVDGNEIDLTPTEFRLLETLASQTDRVLSYRELLSTVWGPEYVNDIDFLRVYIWRLRKKLEEPGGSRWISTERGFGYRLARQQP